MGLKEERMYTLKNLRNMMKTYDKPCIIGIMDESKEIKTDEEFKWKEV